MAENQSKDKKKRQRCKNFSDQEKDFLVDLIFPFRSTVENTKTDAFWNNKKNEAGSEITRRYNVQQTSGVRTDTQLKHLYDALKRDARRESSNDEFKPVAGIPHTHNSKPAIAKNAHEDLNGLDDKTVVKTENIINFEVEDHLYETRLKKAKIDLETSELEKDLMNKKMKYEMEKMESEVRQSKIKEEILLLELKHKQKMLGIL